ncbi:MAG: PAS domain-containing protein [Porticoccaceae bacterium]
MNRLFDNNSMQGLLDSLPAMAWAANEQGRLTYVNRAVVTFTGVPMAQLLASGAFDRVHEDDQHSVRVLWPQAVAGKSDYQARFRMRRSDGQYRWMLTRAEPQWDDERHLSGWFGSTLDIHDEKALDDKNSELGARVSQILEAITDGFVILDDQLRIEFANRAMDTILAAGSAPCAGKDFLAALPAALRDVLAPVVQAGLTEAKALLCQIDERFFDVRCLPQKGGLALSFRDVTENQRAQRLQDMEARVMAMVLREERLATILAEMVRGIEQVLPHAMASVLLLDDDGIHMRHGAAPSLPQAFNSAVAGQPIGPGAGACGTAMYRKEQVVVSDIGSDPLWADYRELALCHGLRACWSTPIFDGAGKVLGSFAVYYRQLKSPGQEDLLLTERISHLAAITIQNYRQEIALRESEARFRQMDEAMDDVFWMEDLHSNELIFLSPTFEKLFGYPAQLFDHQPSSWITLVHPEDRERIQKKVAQAHENWDQAPEALRYRMIRKDGVVRWVDDRAFLIRDGQGRPWRLTGVIRDITDQKALERQLRESQRMEAIGQLTGGIAHDFNNLLTVILGNASLLEEWLADREDLQELARMTATAAQRGADLTQRLLAFARRRSLEPRAVAVPALIEDMMPLLARSLGPHIEIHTRHQPGIWQAMADPSQLENALLNLSINARDAMPGGGRLVIETRNLWLDQAQVAGLGDMRPGPYLRIDVSDTGAGIAAENLEHIFEPFFTTKDVDKGTGLGLAMVYGFARQSQGYISVHSETGAGATFRLFLPRAQTVQDVRPAPDFESAAAPAGERILLVEDDAMVRQFARRQIEALGYRVCEVANGRQALAVLEGGEVVDLLFTDVVMPGMDGPELVRRALALRPDLKVLYTSGYAEGTMHEEGRQQSGVMLDKPYKPGELAGKIRQALEC